jgi:hypothetical protein
VSRALDSSRVSVCPPGAHASGSAAVRSRDSVFDLDGRHATILGIRKWDTVITAEYITQYPSVLTSFCMMTPCSDSPLGSARAAPLGKALLERPRSFPRAPISKLLTLGGAHTFGSRHPLHGGVHFCPDHATSPGHVRGRARADVLVLLAKLRRVGTPLPKERMRRVCLPLEPALTERVIPARVQPPANWQWAKHPRVARTLVVPRVRGVCPALVAA